jgi:galactose mutarotase-like enzyme
MSEPKNYGSPGIPVPLADYRIPGKEGPEDPNERKYFSSGCKIIDFPCRLQTLTLLKPSSSTTIVSMYTLENGILKVEVISKGAELQSLVHTGSGVEYLWNGDPAYWPKRSPVLFPIVGTLKNNTYFYEGRSYQLSRHGFARDMEFDVEMQSPKAITFLLRSNADTKEVYPFNFEFRIRYQISGDELSTEYQVINTGSGFMFFSVGGHPAFRLPLTPNTQFSDYYLRFDENENLARWPISPEGLILPRPVPVLENSNRINLKKSMFYEDALVFKYPASSDISLMSAKTTHGLVFQTGEFPFLGIWSAKDADFICLEPWCGIADAINSNQQLDQKEGIERAVPGKVFSRQWRVKLF